MYYIFNKRLGPSQEKLLIYGASEIDDSQE